jgi:hypothetical protein
MKCSSFLPDFSAAASHRGFSPRPAQVSSGFAGLRYFGATGPRTPPRFERNPFAERRSNLPSWPRTARRASITLELMTASIWLLSFDSLSIDIDFRFMGFLPVGLGRFYGRCNYPENQRDIMEQKFGNSKPFLMGGLRNKRADDRATRRADTNRCEIISAAPLFFDIMLVVLMTCCRGLPCEI